MLLLLNLVAVPPFVYQGSRLSASQRPRRGRKVPRSPPTWPAFPSAGSRGLLRRPPRSDAPRPATRGMWQAVPATQEDPRARASASAQDRASRGDTLGTRGGLGPGCRAVSRVPRAGLLLAPPDPGAGRRGPSRHRARPAGVPRREVLGRHHRLPVPRRHHNHQPRDRSRRAMRRQAGTRGASRNASYQV